MLWGRIYFGVQAAAGAAWWIAVAVSPFVREVTLGGLDPVAVAAADIPLFVVGSALAASGVRPAVWVATGWTLVVAIALAVYATVTTEAGWGALVMATAAVASVLALCLVLTGRVPTAWLIAGPFSFRPALPRRIAAAHLVSTGAQIVVFWGFFLVVVPLVITSLENRWSVTLPFPSFVPVVGAVVLVLASGLGLWSGVTMSVVGNGTPLPAAMANRLVIAGPYRFIRNPMAVAGFLQGAAVGLLLSSWLVVAYGVLGAVLWNHAIRPHEEADLEKRFGDDFRRYRDTVRCWVPAISR
ncbi:isoprenylcysteine carboxylmethyltransferase family protein [Conyzicola nivalis]|uniref:Protein-S-isoprenylcysteine O-methyltransferase n=1 Tax=Conyzicola nivalis TaxID=1477021 RepID=A0A916SLY0_9MICO|nr:isoprenylcysteine carboxylmethyltransferase family protein [Conyzicola nivalis]GGB06970.1 protein-S-isoprenylcysteine O-methyltransferase [Conyzicola nivalis]